MKPRHESQRTQSPDTEGTEPDSVNGSVDSVSDVCALSDKMIFTESGVYAG